MVTNHFSVSALTKGVGVGVGVAVGEGVTVGTEVAVGSSAIEGSGLQLVTKSEIMIDEMSTYWMDCNRLIYNLFLGRTDSYRATISRHT